MARTRKVVQIPPAEAVFILEAMILDGKVPTQTLDEYRARYLAEISTLEAKLARLRDLASPALPAVVGAAVAASIPAVARAARAARPKVVARVMKLTPERIRSRQLQGRYLGLMRQIPKNVVKEQFGKEAIESKGKETVISEMEQYLSEKGSAPSTGSKRRNRARGGRKAAGRKSRR
jgi:hypothetical protein